MAKPQIDLKFGADLKDFRKGISNIDRSLSKMSSGFTALGGVIGASFAVDAIREFGREAIELASQAEGVKRAFERLNDPFLLGDLRKATKGTINDLELMKMAVKAKNFNIPLEQLGNLLGFAQQRATETGESIDYMAESIVLGIARKSIPILDNLGFSATEVREEFKKTGDMATAVGNIIKRQMGEAGEATMTTSEKIAQQRAEMENLKTEIGEELLPIYNDLLEIKLKFIRSLIPKESFGVDDKTEKELANQLLILEKRQKINERDLKNYPKNITYQKNVKRLADLHAATLEKLNQLLAHKNELEGVGQEEKEDPTEDKIVFTKEYIKAVQSAISATRDFQREFASLVQKFENSDLATGPIENIEEEIEDASEVLEDFQGNLDRLYDKREKLQEGFQQMGLILRSTFQDAFRPLEEGETRMEAFTDAFSRMLKQMIVDLLATAAAAALVAVAMTVAFGGVGAAGVSIFGADFKGGFGALFGKTFQGMGGLGFGGGFGGNNGGGMNIMSIIRGQDLLLVQERAGRNRNRSTGIGG